MIYTMYNISTGSKCNSLILIMCASGQMVPTNWMIIMMIEVEWHRDNGQHPR